MNCLTAPGQVIAVRVRVATARAARRPFAVLALAALTLTTTAATASAATIRSDQACYRVGAPVTVSLAGMPPGETIDVRVDDDVAAEVPIDAQGNGSASVTAPRGRPPRAIKLRAQDSLNILAESTFRVAVPVVVMSPTSAKPTSVVRYSLSGFARGGTIYVHVARGGKLLRTASAGSPLTACGVLNVRMAQLPLPLPAKGTYTVQFDQSRTFKAKRAGSVTRTVRVRVA